MLPLLALLLLSGCGGGGGAGTAGNDVVTPPPLDPPPPASVAGLRCTGPKSTGWCWQAPQPRAPVIDDVVFTDSRNGWAVGDALLRTEDGGTSWQERPTPGDAQLRAIRFASPDQGWLLARHGGHLWRTLDGGRNWAATAPLPLPLDHATGLGLFGKQSILVNGLRARDGGRVPEPFTLLSDDAANSWRASAAFVEPGYAESDGTLWSNGAGNGSFAQSTDGGRSFAAPQDWGPSRNIALLLSDGIATALGIQQDSLTGAESWQALQRQAPQGPWTPVDLPPIADGGSLQRLALFATGGWALSLGAVTQEAPLYPPPAPVTLWRREPGAQGWTASALPASGGRLGGYQLVDGRTAWLQLVDEAPWLSTDGGRSWARGFAPSADAVDPLLFVRRDGAGALLAGYRDDDNGNLTGSARWYRSTDDGRSWRALPGTGADGDRITGLWMFDGQRGLASTSGGRWLDTTNAGRDWVARPQAARLPGALQDLQFTPDGTGWVVGRVQQPADALGLRPPAAGELYRSADQGRSWVAVALPAAAAGRVTGVQFVDRQIGFLQAATRCDTVRGYSCNQQTYATRDAGVTWQAVGAEWPTAGVRLMRTATQGLWLPPSGRRAAPPVVITTNDGGATWSDSTVLPAGPDLAVRRMIAVGDRLWILGEDGSSGQGVVLSSRDGGRDWKAQTLPLPADIAPNWLTDRPALHDIAFADDRHGWIVGRQGLVLATTDGGLTWVRHASGSRQTLVTVHAPSANTVWIGGTARSILATASGGR